MRNVSIKAVLIAGVVDILATNVFAIVVVFVASIAEAVRVGPPIDPQHMATALLATPGVTTALYVGGVIASILGGYVAALLARRHELLNGSLSAWLCVGSGLVGTALAHNNNRWPLELLMIPVSPLLGLFGGFLRLAQLRRGVSSAT